MACLTRNYALPLLYGCKFTVIRTSQDFYQALYTQSQAQFDTYVEGGTILNNYAHIFDVSVSLWWLVTSFALYSFDILLYCARSSPQGRARHPINRDTIKSKPMLRSLPLFYSSYS